MGEEFVSDDEFHETFEDIIPSSSGSDADEEAAGTGNNNNSTMRITTEVSEQDAAAAPIWTPTSFQSKFSIWKDDPLSITERRQRFFKQKGLRSSSRDEPLSFTDTASQTSRFFDEEEDDDEQLVKPTTCEKCGGTKKSCAHENLGSKTDNGYKLSKQEEDTPDSSARVKCSSSPEEKTCDCIDKNCNYNSNSSIERPDSSSFSSFDEPKQEQEHQEQQQQHRASSSHENLDEVMSAIENIMEERLKIRDLDSGKEFLMKRFNRDGSLNMLREVATGKDLTLAEFEKTVGLFSPVAQELHRREQRSSIIEAPTKKASKPPVVTKRKSWLKKLKGALKTKERSGGSARSNSSSVPFDSSSQRSVDDNTDTSSQMGSISGDGGSPKRDSSFAGLDRNEFTKRGSLPKEDGEGGFPWKKAQKVKVKVRQKSHRELNDLHLSQEILAHHGAIWTMKFSPDGRFLASAGQDRVVHVWEVVDHPLMADSDISTGDGKLDSDGSVKAGQDRSMSKIDKEGSTKGGKVSLPRILKSSNNHSKSPVPVPKLFWLSEKPMCSFRGHTEDILDLSWSRSQFLLSSSMDKTVRLWHISYDECLRVFSHNDYVTCAQFNPLDDRYFLSGSLDDRVRIWSIPEQHVVDWSDIQEMVTAVCYTPDGKKVIVGSYKGTCRFYNATGNKLQLDAHIDVREENKKARGKKITGLHCMPGDPQKVLVTSNDSRIRVYDGLNLVAKYKGLRNVKSQIASSFSPAGDFIISASEDSRVIVWNSGNRDVSNKTSIYKRDKQLSCEEFAARHVSVAIAWPGSSTPQLNSSSQTISASEPEALPHEPTTTESPDENGTATKTTTTTMTIPAAAEELQHNNNNNSNKCPNSYCLGRSPLGIFGSGRKNSVAVADDHHLDVSSMVDDDSPPPPPARRSSFFPECGPKGGSATWPEEKLAGSQEKQQQQQQQQVQPNGEMNGGSSPNVEFVSSNVVSAAWGLVIVTAGLGGEITTFQNYGFPVRL